MSVCLHTALSGTQEGTGPFPFYTQTPRASSHQGAGPPTAFTPRGIPPVHSEAPQGQVHTLVPHVVRGCGWGREGPTWGKFAHTWTLHVTDSEEQPLTAANH